MLIGRRYTEMSLRQIGEGIGDLSYPAVSDAVRRTTARLEKDRSLQKRLKQVLYYLNLDSAEKPSFSKVMIGKSP
jgi:chromosomal replication initiation ATPase DnaA